MLAVDSNKYNLKNASLFLTQLKIKYAKTGLNSNNQHEKTFMDINEEQEDSITTYNHLNQNYNTNQVRQNSSQTQKYSNNQNSQSQKNSKLSQSGRQNQSLDQPNKLEESKIQQQVMKHISINSEQRKQDDKKLDEKTRFCDLVIIKHLQDTLQLYESDLQILQQNKQNYQQEICFLAQKIKKLPQIQKEYNNLLKQKQKLSLNLKQQIHLYHQSNKQLFKQKLELQKQFNFYKQKIRHFLLFKSCNHYNYNSKIYQNQELISFVQQFENYFQDLQDSNSIIKKKVSSNNLNNLSNQSTYYHLTKQKRDILTTIFGNQCTYLNKIDQLLRQRQQKKQQKIKDKDKDDSINNFDQAATNKTKKLSQAEKALLLGDLRNFSKSFKLPPK